MKTLNTTTLAAPATSIDTGTFDLGDTTQLEVRCIFEAPSGGCDAHIRFNNDSGAAAYSWRYLQEDATNAFDNADSEIETCAMISDAGMVSFKVPNIATSTKSLSGAISGSIGAVFWGKWLNTTDQITRIAILTGNAETFPAGTKLIVMGV